MTGPLWATLCFVAWIAIVYVLVRVISADKDDAPDDERIDSIRGELDSQEMRTRKVRAVQ